MKKFISIFMAMCFVCLLTSSCKEKEDETPLSASIRVETSFGGDDVSAPDYRELLNGFREAYPYITVSDKSVKADNTWKAAIRTSFLAGKEPDVLFFFIGADTATMIANKKLVPIDVIKKKYPNYCNDISGAAYSAVIEPDGKLYTVPVKGIFEGLYCNTKIFEQYGVPLITDWASLEHAIQVFNQKGVTPIAASFSDIPNYWIEHSILSASGVTLHSINPKSISEIPEKWGEGLDLLKQLYDGHAFQEGSLVTQHDLAIAQFNAGKAAMILEGSWMKLDSTIVDDVTVVPFPSQSTVKTEEQGIIGGFSMGFYITTQAWENPAKQDACVKFVEYMTNKEGIAALCRGGGVPAAEQIMENSTRSMKAGMEMCDNYRMEMPIDSRLSKAAWEYLMAKIPAIMRGELKSMDVLQTVAEFNQ